MLPKRAIGCLVRIASSAAGNHPCQFLLEKSVAAAQLLQGVGSGGDLDYSGERSVLERLASRGYVHDPLCVFDVGANRGQFSSLAIECLARRRFHIHAFEPGSSSYQNLFDHLGGSNVVTLNNFGLGNHTGYRELYYDVVGSGLASLTRRRLEHLGVDMGLSETIRVETLDCYCQKQGISSIDLLKLDVEGHELEVLEGAARLFRNSAVAFVTFEFGGCNVDTRTFVQDYFYFFRQVRMKIARITPSGYWHECANYKEVYEQFRTTNFVCYREGPPQATARL